MTGELVRNLKRDGRKADFVAELGRTTSDQKIRSNAIKALGESAHFDMVSEVRKRKLGAPIGEGNTGLHSETGKKVIVPASPIITSRHALLLERSPANLEQTAKALAAEGKNLKSAVKFARAARIEENPEQKGTLYAQAAEQATLACNLNLTLLFDKNAMIHFREVLGYPSQIEHPLARAHRIKSGKRYLDSANDQKNSWTEAERNTLREYAKARMPDNQGTEIHGSGVGSSTHGFGVEPVVDYYARFGE